MKISRVTTTTFEMNRDEVEIFYRAMSRLVASMEKPDDEDDEDEEEELELELVKEMSDQAFKAYRAR